MDKPPKYNTVVLREDPPEYMVSQNIGKLMRIGCPGSAGNPGVRVFGVPRSPSIRGVRAII